MNRRPRNSLTCSSQQAFTLVEVIASLALLGTLLVGILVAQRRHAEQINGAHARLTAVEAADKLLAQWSAGGNWGTASSSGQFEDEPKLMWHWSVIQSPELRPMGAAIGRLEVFAKENPAELPFVRVDVVTADAFSQVP